MRKHLQSVLAVVLAMTLTLPGCGIQNVQEPTKELPPSDELVDESASQAPVSNGALEASPPTTPQIEDEQVTAAAPVVSAPQPSIEPAEVAVMKLQIGDSVFAVTLEDNDAAAALVELLQSAPLVMSMSDYSGFEKVGSLGYTLPTSDSQTTATTGDIMLYNGNQIVIFYGSNSWSYTRLGRIDDLTGWNEALGSGDVIVTFSIE